MREDEASKQGRILGYRELHTRSRDGNKTGDQACNWGCEWRTEYVRSCWS